MHLGEIYQEKGMMQEAISEYQQVISLSPESADAHKELASALEKVGLHGMAETEMEIYMKLMKNKKKMEEKKEEEKWL